MLNVQFKKRFKSMERDCLHLQAGNVREQVCAGPKLPLTALKPERPHSETPLLRGPAILHSIFEVKLSILVSDNEGS